MPTYEYECQKCKDRFEVFQSMTAKPLKKCSQCGGVLNRIIGSGAGIIFKGSGFYATDYRSANYKAKERQEKSQIKPPACSKNCPSQAVCSKKSDKDN